MAIPPGSTVIKDPAAELIYQFDWSPWLGYQGSLAQISSSSWSIVGPDSQLTSDNPTVISGNLKTQLRLKGGTVGKTYTLTNHIVTNETPSQTDERSIAVNILDR